MWSMRTLTPFFSLHCLAKSSSQASYAGTKWLHIKTRRLVPLSCAGAWRAESSVTSELPASPAPATLTNARRLTVEDSVGTGRRSLMKASCVGQGRTEDEPFIRAAADLSSGILDRVRRRPPPWLVLVLVLIGIGAFTGGLAALLDTPRPPLGAPRAQRLYVTLCAPCHG